jgi:hypothetical protein
MQLARMSDQLVFAYVILILLLGDSRAPRRALLPLPASTVPTFAVRGRV